MIALPNECLFEILINLKNYYRFLFSCLLVNRQWCSNVIPILWSDPLSRFRDRRLIRVYLLTLNAKERTQLVSLNILPNNSNLLFEYTTYTTIIDPDNLYKGILNWLHYEKHGYKKSESVIHAVELSLIEMFLRTSKIFKNKIMKLLVEVLYENTTITSLDLFFMSLIFEDVKALAKTLYKNTVLNSLTLRDNNLGPNEAKILALALYENTTLFSLNLGINCLGYEGGKFLAELLCKIPP